MGRVTWEPTEQLLSLLVKESPLLWQELMPQDLWRATLDQQSAAWPERNTLYSLHKPSVIMIYVSTPELFHMSLLLSSRWGTLEAGLLSSYQ